MSGCLHFVVHPGKSRISKGALKTVVITDRFAGSVAKFSKKSILV